MKDATVYNVPQEPVVLSHLLAVATWLVILLGGLHKIHASDIIIILL